MEEKQKNNHNELEEKLLLLRIQERIALDKIILNISIAIVGYVVGYILNSDVFKDIYNKKFYINSSVLI